MSPFFHDEFGGLRLAILSCFFPLKVMAEQKQSKSLRSRNLAAIVTATFVTKEACSESVIAVQSIVTM